MAIVIRYLCQTQKLTSRLQKLSRPQSVSSYLEFSSTFYAMHVYLENERLKRAVMCAIGIGRRLLSTELFEAFSRSPFEYLHGCVVGQADKTVNPESIRIFYCLNIENIVSSLLLYVPLAGRQQQMHYQSIVESPEMLTYRHCELRIVRLDRNSVCLPV